MSIYNSQASLINNSEVTQIIGTLVLDPEEISLFWDTTTTSRNNIVWNNFQQVRDNHGDTVYPLLQDGSIQIIHDGIYLNSNQSLAVLSKMYTQMDKNNNISQLLSTGISLKENKDDRGFLKVVEEKRTGTELDIATHNLCDKTTWFTNSIRITGEQPTNIDNFSYKLANNYIIDMNRGKIFNEDKFAAELSHGYRVRVTSNGTEMDEYSIFNPDGYAYDYEVDYVDGYINFTNSQAGNNIVVDYSYATDSIWILSPKPGKVIQIEHSEVQFSADLSYDDAIDFEIWAYNPADLPNKIMIDSTSYKSINNFIDEGRGAYPIIPAIGGGGILGKSQATYGFPFNYNTVRRLNSSQGVEVRIRTRNNREFGGERATATFYCTVMDEE